MKVVVVILIGLLLAGCSPEESDAFDMFSGDTSKVQVYAANSGAEPIHIFPKGLDRFNPSNRVNPGAKQVSMATLIAIPEGKEAVKQVFIAGRNGVEIYSETCEVAAKQRTIVEYTGSGLACRYELKPGAVAEDEPETGIGTTG